MTKHTSRSQKISIQKQLLALNRASSSKTVTRFHKESRDGERRVEQRKEMVQYIDGHPRSKKDKERHGCWID